MVRRRHSGRRPRGQVTVEAVLVILLLCLIFMGLAQVTWLYVGQLITDHTAFVTGRSYIVGYHPELVQRAKEVGSIGAAGPILEPADCQGLTPAELSAREPLLIEEHVTNGSSGSNQFTTLDYTYWPQVYAYGVYPWSDHDQLANIHVRIWDYPLDMPMASTFAGDGAYVDLDGHVDLFDHAEAYLE